MSTIFILILLVSCTLHLSTSSHIQNRRVLHQPYFPLSSTSPSPSPSPSSSPQPQPQKQQPKVPFSSSPAAGTNSPFFPSVSSPPAPPTTPTPPPPSPISSSIPATFPANISSLVLPETPSPKKPISTKLVTVAAVIFSITLLFILALILYYKRRRRTAASGKASRSDSLRLYPANSTASDSGTVGEGGGDGGKPPRGGASATSSEFLYLGTVVSSRGGAEEGRNPTDPSVSAYQKLGSPELRPLPPLPRQNISGENPKPAEEESSLSGDTDGNEEDEEFYSPRGSVGSKERTFQAVGAEKFGTRSFNSPTASYPSSSSASPTHSTFNNTPSPQMNSSPRSSSSRSPDSVIKFPAPPLRPAPPPPPQRRRTLSVIPSPPSSPPERELPVRISDASHSSSGLSPERSGSMFYAGQCAPPPPPPPPPPRPPQPPQNGYWEVPTAEAVNRGPPVLVTPTRPIVFQNGAPPMVSHSGQPRSAECAEKSGDTPKPKLKPLHWDKVRASSDRAMVWDQLKSSSFKLNEEMIETLFMVNGSNGGNKDNLRRAVLTTPCQENQVLDPKKSQNIAILLRALNVTIDEVCEALLEGNVDTLGTELLESLLKMAPTKQEEHKLRDFKDDSPVKLGPAERFLKAVIDVPFAFKRVDAMLYIANFDSEVEYLIRSFETLEAACEELRSSRMFMKLLEAVLKTGNRMNVGTTRGDARAFKLDTLLKLVDVKGADGKTTLLHFVVQEIIRAEGSRLSTANRNQTDDKTPQSALRDDVEFRKLGLQVVSSLSGELTNVKKAATMDSDVLDNDVGKLAGGVAKVKEVVKLIEELALKESSWKFSHSMNGFIIKAEEQIIKIQAQERVALSLVKELTAYFHGSSAKEEAHHLRIFAVVRDFLSTLDHVCKEVGKINERTIVSSGRQFPKPVNPITAPTFLGFHERHHYNSSDDESTSSSSS